MTIHELVDLQRSVFYWVNPYSVEDRLAALELLRDAMLRREADIYRALEEDLGKCPGEAFMTEIGMVLAEIGCAMRNLRRWAAPRRVRTPLA